MRERLTAIIAIILLVFLIGASYWYAMKTSLGTLRYVPSDITAMAPYAVTVVMMAVTVLWGRRRKASKGC